MEKNTAIKKIKESAVTVHAIMIIVSVIMAAITAILGFFAVYANVSDKGMKAAAKYIARDRSASLSQINGAIGMGIAKFLVFTVIAILLTKFFAKISANGLPFEKDNLRYLENAGGMFILNGILPGVVQLVITVVASGLSQAHFSLDIGMMFVGAVILLVHRVFTYGAVLQQESDETI